MPLIRMIRRLFPKFEPQTVLLNGFGETTSDRYGYWHVQRPVDLVDGLQVEVSFKADLPGEREFADYQTVVDGWSTVWSSIISRLRIELWDDGPYGEREVFIANARPIVLRFDEGLDLWEVQLDEDIYQGHIVTMLMNGLDCQLSRLDG